jgi:phosphoribosylformylglycinamidine synthase
LDALQADDPLSLPAPKDLGETLLSVLSSPNIASKRWVTEQYDWMVQHNTVLGPGADAAVIRLEGSQRGFALSTDGNARYCALDPRTGAMLAVAEAARNVACTGALPIAITNCLNFGNPERADVMWQFAEAVAGIADACLAFSTPVTGGNVSFYNETDGESIKPTPVIGMLGLIRDVRTARGIAFEREGDAIVLLGETKPELGGSEFAWHVHGHLGGMPPSIDLRAEHALHELLVDVAERDLAYSAHDVSEGGLAVALAECALALRVGARLHVPSFDHVFWFSESASRAVLTCAHDAAPAVLEAAERLGVPAAVVGETGGDRLTAEGAFDLALADLADAYDNALARAIAAAV